MMHNAFKTYKDLNPTLPNSIGLPALLHSILNGFCPRKILSASTFSYISYTLQRFFLGDTVGCTISSAFGMLFVVEDSGLKDSKL